jgi:hypothetical protein
MSSYAGVPPIADTTTSTIIIITTTLFTLRLIDIYGYTLNNNKYLLYYTYCTVILLNVSMSIGRRRLYTVMCYIYYIILTVL